MTDDQDIEDEYEEEEEEEEVSESVDSEADATLDSAGNSTEKKKKKKTKKSVLTYTPEFEQLLKENGDHAQMYSILHQMAYLKYKRLFDRINIPLIVITAVIGFVTGIGVDYAHAGIILGAGSMAVSVAKSIMSYMKWSEQSENHRICSLQFGQIATEIKTELSLRKEQRQPPKIMLDFIKVKLKNLMEVAHILDPDVIHMFRQKYLGTVERDVELKMKQYQDSGVTFPPIFSDLPGIKILGANTEAERTTQQQKSIQDHKAQLAADLERIKIDHQHERDEVSEEIEHNNMLRKIQAGIKMSAPPIVSSAGPPPSVLAAMVSNPLRQPLSRSQGGSRKNAVSNSLVRGNSLDPALIASTSNPIPE